MKTTEDCSSSSSIDQLHLPVDVVGHLLSVLSTSDVECTRLVCQSWKQAIDHQLTAIRPLHLPRTSGTTLDGCTALHAPILRCAGQSAAADTAAPVGLQFAWQAPHVNLDKALSSVKNVNDLDLSGQMLVYDNCLQQLAQKLTCLRSLKLDACKVLQEALSQLTAFVTAGRTGLTQLSLAGLTYGHEVKGSYGARAQGQRVPRPAAGAGPAASQDTPSVTVDDMLGAIAANPLVDLDLSTGVQDKELMASAGPLIRFPTRQMPGPVKVAGRCQLLAPLGSTLRSLKLLGNIMEPGDWETICSGMTRLTELHITWDMTAPIFASISQLQGLQSLRVTFQGAHQGVFDPYTLAPLAQTLTSVHLNGSNSLSLLLSLTECTSLQELQLQGVRGAAGAPELMVQILHSLPLLRELKLAAIQAPSLQRATVNFLGDYLVQQLDCCCPHLTKLVLADAPFTGTGIRLAATSVPVALPKPAAPAAAAADDDDGGVDRGAWGYGSPGQGGLRSLKHLEVNAAGLYCSALPHLSCLTGLESLTLWDMTPARFLHNCRFDCFRFVSALTNLNSFNIPAMSVRWLPAAAAAAAAGAAIDEGDAAFELGAGQLQEPPPGVGEAVVGDLADMHLNQAAVDAGDANGWQGEDEDWDSDEWESMSEEDEESSGGGEGAAAGYEHAEGVGGPVGQAAGGPVGQAAGGLQVPDILNMMHVLQQAAQALQAAAVPEAAAALGFDWLEQAMAAQAQPMQQQVQQAMQMGPGLQQAMHNALAAAGGVGPLGVVPGQPLPPPQMLQGPAAPAANGAANDPAALLQLLAQANELVQELQEMLLQQQHQQGGQAQQQGAAGGGAPVMGPAPQQHVQGAAAAGAVGPAAGALGQGQAALQGALQRPTVDVMEPHLHFLCRLNSLVSINIGCLITRGPCLMHLSHLTSLQTLVLSGCITLTPASLQLLQKLRMPSVKHLSITDCSLDLGSSAQQQQQQAQAPPAAAAAAVAAGSSSSSGNSQAGASGTLPGPQGCIAPGQGQLYPMDSFVPVLSAAFPACENLKLGSCDNLSIVGLAALLQQLPNLQRLWVCGMRDDGQVHFCKPHNFVSTAAAAKLARDSRQSNKLVSDGVEPLEHGYFVPYDPYPPRKPQQKARSQLPWELAWFLGRGVVIPLKSYDGASATVAAGAAAAAELSAPNGPFPASMAALPAAAGSPAAAAAAAPVGAVAVPCAAVSGLKYVALVRNDSTAARVFTRYHGRLMQGVHYCIWNDRA